MSEVKLPDCLQCIEKVPGYPILVLNHPTATAKIALNGAHIMEWTPSGHRPVLYMSPDAVLAPGKAIRGGIPICWPWFGPHLTRSDAPAHGIARLEMWSLVSAVESADGVNLVFALKGGANDHSAWGFPFSLKCTVALGAELEVSLEIENPGQEAWTMAGALHTYLSVHDISEVLVTGLHGTQFVEGRLSPERRWQTGPVRFGGEVDRLYVSDSTVEVHDVRGGRTLIVEKAGSRSTVVWNPWIEKSKRLADLPDDAYLGFLCVEAANAGEDLITVQPGSRHVLSTRVRLRVSN